MRSYLETTPDAPQDFREEKRFRSEAFIDDQDFQTVARDWRAEAQRKNYTYGFSWLGRPVIQHPQDIMAIQEILWAVRPNVVIETGIAHGGSLVLTASILELLGGRGKVVGVDVDIRAHNRAALDAHPLRPRMELIEGSSIDAAVISQVTAQISPGDTVAVILDSNHTHDHVLAELEAYAPLVSPGSYCVVFDTLIEELGEDFDWGERPWRKGDNPRTAVDAWLPTHPEFEVDRSLEARLMITSAPGGYLRRIAP